MNVTNLLARFAVEKNFADIPQAAVGQAKMGVLDWLAAALAALSGDEKNVTSMLDLASEMGGRPQATIIGSETKTSLPLTAMINGFIGHLMDFDDTCPPVRSHLTTSILPAVLAAGEARGTSGREVLLGYIIGYETSLRVGQALSPGWMKDGWHGTPVFGVFGAAAASGRILGLNAAQMQNALGVAASMASGLAKNFGSLTKPLHAGLAAKNGVLAALLAQRGITANKEAIEGPVGFFHAYAKTEEPDLEPFAKLGRPWGLERPGMLNPKLYPCCHGLSTNIELALLIRQRHQFALDDVAEIEIHSQPKTLSAMLSINYQDTGEPLAWGYDGPPRQLIPAAPQSGKEAKFSKEYALARALVDGSVRVKDFTDEAVKEPAVQALMKKTRVFHNSRLEKISYQHPDEELPYGEKVLVKLKDGGVIEAEEIFTLGSTKRPLTMAPVKEKFAQCASEAGLSAERSQGLTATVEGLESLEAISGLVSQLAGFY